MRVSAPVDLTPRFQPSGTVSVWFKARAPDIDRPLFRPGSRKAYLVATLIVLLATLVGLAARPLIIHLPFLALFPAVLLVTFLCGARVGVLAAVLSVGSAWLFTLHWHDSYLPIYQSAHFFVGSITVAAVIALMRSAMAHVRHANDTLRISEAKFRGLLESAPDAIVIIDGLNHITLVNAQAEQLFGYSREELLGEPIERLLPVCSRDQYLTQLTAFMGRAGHPADARTFELDGACKDGRAFPIEVSFGPIDTEAGTLIANVIRDITARREIEHDLAQASKAKSDFLASMSHELRTPLNAIIGFSEMIRDAIIGPLDARYREYGGDISESATHLRNIINDILDISKIEGGRLDLHDELVSLSEAAQACGRIVAPMAEEAGVDLSIGVSASLPLIEADQLRLQQILLNLLSNAVKFTAPGGRVNLSVAVNAGAMQIAVADTGIGMSPDEVAIALQPFRQVDGELSRRFDGTGLGLPLAKALVELHGGTLDVESEQGVGTTVRIALPAERIDHGAAEAGLPA